MHTTCSKYLHLNEIDLTVSKVKHEQIDITLPTRVNWCILYPPPKKRGEVQEKYKRSSYIQPFKSPIILNRNTT
jgi:hypothetical protein